MAEQQCGLAAFGRAGTLACRDDAGRSASAPKHCAERRIDFPSSPALPSFHALVEDQSFGLVAQGMAETP
jgi:hypothetical protein